MFALPAAPGTERGTTVYAGAATRKTYVCKLWVYLSSIGTERGKPVHVSGAIKGRTASGSGPSGDLHLRGGRTRAITKAAQST